MFPYDAITISGFIPSGAGASTTLVSYPATILQYFVDYTDAAGQNTIASCGTKGLYYYSHGQIPQVSFLTYLYCESTDFTVKPADNNFRYIITYIPRIDTASSGGGTSTTTVFSTTTNSFPFTYHDWLFVSMVNIFLLSFVCLGLVFSFFRLKKR